MKIDNNTQFEVCGLVGDAQDLLYALGLIDDLDHHIPLHIYRFLITHSPYVGHTYE
jgi:hypothetical protein